MFEKSVGLSDISMFGIHLLDFALGRQEGIAYCHMNRLIIPRYSHGTAFNIEFNRCSVLFAFVFVVVGSIKDYAAVDDLIGKAIKFFNFSGDEFV